MDGTQWHEKQQEMAGRFLQEFRPVRRVSNGRIANWMTKMLQLSSKVPMTYRALEIHSPRFSPATGILQLDVTLRNPNTARLSRPLRDKIQVCELEYQPAPKQDYWLPQRFFIRLACTNPALIGLLKAGKIWASDEVEVIFQRM